MSAFIVCPICGKTVTCSGHPTPQDNIGSSSTDCPLKKGAIYVYVKDDRGAGVKDVQVTCAGQHDADPEGFALFDQLDKGDYPTSIDLTPTLKIEDVYYIFSKPNVLVPLGQGEITMVEFQLNRYAILKVAVKRSDKPKIYLKDAVLNVERAGQKNSLDTGPVPFDKLKRDTYKVTAALAQSDKDNFTFDNNKSEINYSIGLGSENLVEFLVSPACWIEFKLMEVVDKKDKDLAVVAKLKLEKAGEKMHKDTKGDGTQRLEKLEPGNMDLLGVELTESYEFVEWTPA